MGNLPHAEVPHVKNDMAIGEDLANHFPDVATIVRHGHLRLRDAKEGETSLQAREQLLDF